MTNYIRIVDKKILPYSMYHLHRDYSNISFPVPTPDELLAEYGVFEVYELPEPEYDERTQKISKQEEPTQINGQWTYGYDIITKSDEEIARYDAQVDGEKRRVRDNMLKNSDWIVLRAFDQGEEIPPDWKRYREKLRELPQTTGWPHNIDWPVAPE